MGVTLEQFVQHLTRSGLMSDTEVVSFQETLPSDRKPKDGESLARELVRANKLTKYQAQVVYQGKVTQSGQVMGTCDYMAPEQAQDTRRADQRSDVYSLGCTLYRLLTGKVPYSGESLVQILLAHQNAPTPSLRNARPDVPESVEAIFQKMMAKRPEERYQSMGEVIADVEACLGSSTRPPVAGLVEEPPSEFLPQSLAFLQDAPPVAAATKQRKTVAGEDTLRRAVQDETGTSITGRLKQAIAKAGRKPLVMLGVAGGSALLGILVALIFSLVRPTREGRIEDRQDKSVASAARASNNSSEEFPGLSQTSEPGEQGAKEALVSMRRACGCRSRSSSGAIRASRRPTRIRW